jgi:hypothetical protein
MIFIDKVRRECRVRNRFSIDGFKPMKEEKAKEYFEEYKKTFCSKSKSEENPFQSVHGIQKLMCMMYKNVFGCAPFGGVASKEMVDGKRVSVYHYEDGGDDDWEQMKVLQTYSKLSYQKKKDDKHNQEQLNFALDSDSDDE